MATSSNTNGERPAPCLEFDHTWFSYDGAPVIEDVTFSVERGDFVAILGPNGSGKTTLLKLALGLLQPTRGSVRLFGRPPHHFHEWYRVGYVPQALEGVSGQFPATVEEVVAQGLYRGFDPLSIWRRSGKTAVLKALETVGVPELRRRRIGGLSVGQQQRAMVARALVRDPEMLVLDEPVAGVDVAGQEQFYALLRRLNHQHGITIVMVSHDIGAVMHEATTVACINRTIVFHGPPHKLTQRELSTIYGLPMSVLLHDLLHEHR